MIAIVDLLKQRLPGNYFATDAYIKGDFEAGLIENRRGDRLLALPETLVQAIYAGIEQETGQAAGVVLFNCGRWWGKNFYARFVEEVSDYYGKPLAEMEMVELLQCLKQCWKTHGWGTFDFDMSYYQQGFLVVKIWNSPFAQQAPQGAQPACFLEAGILSAFFSQLTGRQLHCVQTSCESLEADCNRFVLGMPERLKPAQVWLEEKHEHETVMARLCRSKT
ncbi:V4R domain-containing protein [Gloeocapsopsis dulcis]|uniref:4-vinyl reductase n=1 Tax=Gloeocapsopsis dulcis AAB1 = 1H9 TaxID=1433147 RepID=A0A6N8FW71_9CHRO|nr:V4R domain-containing protein [Gloeocapsopsis dulcis]MUL36852.1 4-vinyl reductase [Gloeocapsopsis dulcis AAB1 = 1H9]WNN88540.1 4-vinyl reductase [Gloeocapsopsis dulcis]